ncbi:MAG: hypothetical protein PHW96_01160 [Candidatus Nanoarchaeia archaeon]|nr:hypothetical protein [Candidatus Omnitrophota bacterium]MDD5417482.1 hypothetical protein [Candidatus Nanoarchaeia archaeon]
MEREDTKELIYRIAGEEGLTALSLIPDKGEPANEFDIAENLLIKINSLRNTLYKLYELKIVSFTKQKDNKKGWYIYFWLLNLKQLIYLLVKEKETRIEQLQAEVERNESAQFFTCDTCGMEYDYLQAMEDNFVCPSCEKAMGAVNKGDFVSMLKQEVEKLTKEIEDLKEIRNTIGEIQKSEIAEEERKVKDAKKRKKAKEKREKAKEKAKEKGNIHYFCDKCNQKHKKDSKIGKEHINFNSKKYFWCSLCEKKHAMQSSIGKKHKEYK